MRETTPRPLHFLPADVPPVSKDARAQMGTHAGLASRVVANVIDFVVALLTLGGIYLGVTTVKFLWRPRSFSFPAVTMAQAAIAGAVLTGLYFAVSWMTTGRTLGDLVLGLRVVTRSGRRVRAAAALLRAAACVVFPIGLLWSLVDVHGYSVQDLVFRTAVVYDWPGTAG